MLHSKPMIRSVVLAATSALFFGIVAPIPAQVRPKYSTGAPGLLHLLQRLTTTASVLHTGAHPDDESSDLMARLARGDHARVAFFSLTRGDGGQNVIGPELFEGLGVIRTEELLQARRLDGGDQLFGRAFDFGFSKTLVESAARWGEEVSLDDMVRAIRIYRPLVVVSQFAGTESDGHGHHQFVGYLTPLAFRQAGDPNRFPEQIAEGLRPWQPLKLYISERFGSDTELLQVQTGILDRPLGRTYFEIAMEGRSQHKSQEMGMLELRGPRSTGLKLVESRVTQASSDSHIFDGIDTSLAGIPRTSGLSEGVIDEALGRAQAAAERALEEFDPLAPEEIIPWLAQGLGAVREARRILNDTGSLDANARYEAHFLLTGKEDEFEEALQQAAGVVVDGLAASETVIPGQSVVFAVRVFYPETSPVRVEDVSLKLPEGWTLSPADSPELSPRQRFFSERGQQEGFFRVTVAEDAPPTQPYWLTAPRESDVFTWGEGAAKGMPFGPPVAEAIAAMKIGDVELQVSQPIEHRFADPARGEIRRELNVVPALNVSLGSNLLIVPRSAGSRTERMAVRLENNAESESGGVVRLDLPDGWRSEPSQARFSLARKGEGTAVMFDIEIPANASSGTYTVGVEAESAGRTYNQEMTKLDYPHIQTHRFYTPAETMIQVMDLRVESVRIGYIMGSGDLVPAAIQRLGLGVELLDEEDLATGDLSRFDTIVVGVRASQVRADFVANHGRIMDWVRQGGTLIIQYQRRDYVSRGLPPYPAQMQRPPRYSNHRITDETASMRILAPQNPVFNFPNRITPTDWEGWVQERSLYHLTDLDPRYTSLVEAADPGEEPHSGGLVYAEVGRGKYVYAGISFFRQLPAGVPGAYRLFANLLSLPKAP
jgi:LmbE family N-acetylglucosaminyl deacetylase